jgi:hypothetical protein
LADFGCYKKYLIMYVSPKATKSRQKQPKSAKKSAKNSQNQPKSAKNSQKQLQTSHTG